jgi:hypothetical protein
MSDIPKPSVEAAPHLDTCRSVDAGPRPRGIVSSGVDAFMLLIATRMIVFSYRG